MAGIPHMIEQFNGSLPVFWGGQVSSLLLIDLAFVEQVAKLHMHRRVRWPER